MEIKINKEIKEYNETMFFGLSVRQFVFSLVACGVDIYQPQNRYHLIYADPPWNYLGNRASWSAKNHYPTMPTQEIQKLPVERIAKRDAVLFLWVTYPFFQDGLDVIRAWGFQYKTCAFCWVKQYRNGGVYIGLFCRSQLSGVYQSVICRLAGGAFFLALSMSIKPTSGEGYIIDYSTRKCGRVQIDP